MKIAVIMPIALQRGGSETMLTNLLLANKQTADLNYQIAFLEDGPMVAETAEIGYDTTVIQAGRLRSPYHYWRAVVRLTHWIRSSKADLVLSWMGKAQLYGGPASVLAGVPNTWWQHSIDPGNWLDTWATLLPAKCVFCDSEETARVQSGFWPKRTTHVCYCAVDLELFDPSNLPTPSAARQRLHLPLDRPIIGTVARLQHWKGVHIFLEAAAKVVASGRDAYFIVVGGKHLLEPDYPARLERQITASGLTEHVLMAGYQKDVPLWMQTFDVFVHSAVKVEPFGTVVVEAMALGKKVIAARAGGPMESVRDGQSGILVQPDNPHALAAAMEQLLLDSATNEAMCHAASERATYFSKERLANQVADYMVKILPQA